MLIDNKKKRNKDYLKENIEKIYILLEECIFSEEEEEKFGYKIEELIEYYKAIDNTLKNGIDNVIERLNSIDKSERYYKF